MTEHLARHFLLEREPPALTRNCHSQHTPGPRQQGVCIELQPLDVRYHAHNATGSGYVAALCQGLFRLCDPVNSWVDLYFWVPIATASERTRRREQTDNAHRHCHHLNTALRDRHFQYSLFEGSSAPTGLSFAPAAV